MGTEAEANRVAVFRRGAGNDMQGIGGVRAGVGDGATWEGGRENRSGKKLSCECFVGRQGLYKRKTSTNLRALRRIPKRIGN